MPLGQEELGGVSFIIVIPAKVGTHTLLQQHKRQAML